MHTAGSSRKAVCQSEPCEGVLLIRFRRRPHYFLPQLQVLALKKVAHRLRSHRFYQLALRRLHGDQLHQATWPIRRRRAADRSKNPLAVLGAQWRLLAGARKIIEGCLRPTPLVALPNLPGGLRGNARSAAASTLVWPSSLCPSTRAQSPPVQGCSPPLNNSPACFRSYHEYSNCNLRCLSMPPLYRSSLSRKGANPLIMYLEPVINFVPLFAVG